MIRLLQTKLRRKVETAINPGNEQNTPVGAGTTPVFPDLVLFSLERGRRLQGVIEVETGESVNHLEALAQWTHLSKLRAEFHLYVPAGMVDVARRLCEDNQILVNEIWSYHSIGDQVRFTLVHRNRDAAAAKQRLPVPKPAPAPVKTVPVKTPPAKTPPAKATAPARTPKKPARTAPPPRKAAKAKPKTKKPVRAQKRK